jgi:hypothetical protein
MTKNESKTDSYTRFQKILCVFLNYFDFLVKMKPNEKAIQKMIFGTMIYIFIKSPSVIESLPPS